MGTRRNFIKTTSLGVAGLPLLAHGFNLIKPSDKIRLAIIGVGGISGMHIKGFVEHDDVDIVAICDVNQLKIKEKLSLLQELRPHTKVDAYTDFRQVLDRKDIDAVSIATPDHWHALIAIMAFESGKDVYGEKPLSHNVKEGQVMLKSLQRNKRVFQMNNFIHSSDNFHRVAEIIQSGVLGKIKTVRLWKSEQSESLGYPTLQTPPETLDWNMWLGPAPNEPYSEPRASWTWRLFYDYGSGVFGDFWCHITDVVYMALGPKGLKEIETRGKRRTNGIAETPYWFEADFKFDDLNLFWTTEPPKEISGAENMGIGAYFEGEQGTLLCDYFSKTIQIGNETFKELPGVPITLKRSPGAEGHSLEELQDWNLTLVPHQRNFFNCMKSRELPKSNLAYSRELTLPMHLALISFRLKRNLQWNPETEQFINDPAANAMLSRTYREPWNLSQFE
ncbi:Gfo/Idh/MocA family oxidoreductase [Seonamhaeicola sp.]|uniref:Gfo/Idh/MocA family protein n=1 Tax=Seonamhaeicola sp. TaxID=1912245 RepID=UPI002619D11D|nr:Gfo/Idh/MocA family oxidoreductase [Seonamhaeicola sp.]